MSTSSSKQPFWREALTFSRSERIGIMVLLMLALSVWWIPAMFGNRREPAVTTIRMDSLLSKLPDPAPKEDRYTRFEKRSAGEKYSPAEIHAEAFPFDPNEATPNDWRRLGLSDRTITTIGRFQEKGGKFRKPEDIRKIYGLSPKLAARLMPFVRISTPAAKDRPYQRDSIQFATKLSRPAPSVIDINQADSAAWESLPGIGPTLAGRIIKYRNRLGGFHRMEQVGETYGLADSVFRSIEHRLRLSEAPSADRIPVNTATFEQLSRHPYIPYRMARAIIAYRDQHGPYKGRDDLMRIALMTPDGLDKILPYLQFEP